MRKTKIAPYIKEDCPKINFSGIYGASPKQNILYRIPVSGKRPINIMVDNLPDTMKLDGEILSGYIEKEGKYTILITAENPYGKDQRELLLDIANDNIGLTPLMGWTSWNAFAWGVTQEKIWETAKLLVSSGMTDFGYQYINVDSTWQGNYGGKYNAIMPNEKFPDMKNLCDSIHSLGLKCGIYSTPMLNAWGDKDGALGIPGCTRGVPDPKFSDMMGGIGTERFEKENVVQWEEWGFDYLKYDWDPCDPYNANIMKQALVNSSRDFMFCVTVAADIKYANFWTKNCNSWRDNKDSMDDWQRVVDIYDSGKKWNKHIVPGHFFDYDMLETGYRNSGECKLSEDEQIFSMSFRAFFNSPIQVSCDLSKLTDFDMALYCNNEIISVNQDSLCSTAECIIEKNIHTDTVNTRIEVYKKKLLGDKIALGIFNPGETEENVSIPLENKSLARDNWAKEDIGVFDKTLDFSVPPHTARIITLSSI